ncbi:CLUMA_CG000583, isoform A [Clunio marinus]|uniref:CLUMA_CG000583, isoform A n=1 Tax=Clunio marinus TaxID=568069 RepID=A0A1J1HFK4_9DIPT|nr:CLUMA_CG000583, isoform A [Clunio marinus]
MKNGKKQNALLKFPLFHFVSYNMEKALKKHKINAYYTSRGNLKDLLSGSKDKILRKKNQD